MIGTEAKLKGLCQSQTAPPNFQHPGNHEVANFTRKEDEVRTLDVQVCQWFLHPPTIHQLIPAMLVYDNWQVQMPNGIGDAAGKVVLEAV